MMPNMPKDGSPSIWYLAEHFGNLTRVTVNLTSRSSAALAKAIDITADSETNVINRAIRVYAYLAVLELDGRVFIVESPDGSHSKLIFV